MSTFKVLFFPKSSALHKPPLFSSFDRCSHCRKLAATWKALAEYHKDNVDIAIAKVPAHSSQMFVFINRVKGNLVTIEINLCNANNMRSACTILRAKGS